MTRGQTGASEQGTGREGRWRRWLLVVSLAFNLLIVGIVVGAIAKDGPPRDRAGRVDLTMGPLTRALSDEDRAAIGETLRRNRPFDLRERRALRQDLAEMVDLLAAEGFDAVAFRSVMTRQRDRLATAQSAAMDAVIDRIGAMSVAERQAFAERLGQEMHRVRRDRPERTDRDDRSD